MRVRLLPVASAFLLLMAAQLCGAAHAREIVAFAGYRPGTVVVKTAERRLYFVTGGGRAIRYPVAVGRSGKQWQGRTRIVRKAPDPHWQPPRAVRAANPSLPQVVPPGPSNPLGPRALVLGADEYAIHGTNAPSSIGRAVSWGCIRMHNADILDLYERVRVGTTVIVTR